ncbi:MAG TPA: 4Fe-4S dicluster domain-containing protein, partial [Polyangia bacterium]
SRTPEIQWIRVLEMDKEEGVNIQHAEQYYNPEEVPREGHFYMPVQCQQCKKPPCVKVCPVGATWREKDGITVVDYNWCIGCRYCMAACPYGARHFNWGEPHLDAADVNPDTHYLGNRPRPKGVVEKCTFCIQRTRKGLYPACVEICPTGSRKFGNLLDAKSEIREILENMRVFKFKEDLNTQPNFFYFYGVWGHDHAAELQAVHPGNTGINASWKPALLRLDRIPPPAHRPGRLRLHGANEPWPHRHEHAGPSLLGVLHR